MSDAALRVHVSLPRCAYDKYPACEFRKMPFYPVRVITPMKKEINTRIKGSSARQRNSNICNDISGFTKIS